MNQYIPFPGILYDAGDTPASAPGRIGTLAVRNSSSFQPPGAGVHLWNTNYLVRENKVKIGKL